MRVIPRHALALVCLAVILFAPRAALAITLDQVVALAKSGVTETVILALIDRDRTVFAIEQEQIVSLQRDGLSEKIILAMLKSGRDEGDAAFAQQAAQAAADRDAAVWLAPNVVVIGHGPDRPNTGYRDGQYSSPRPWALYGVSGEFFPAFRRPLCLAQAAARPGHAGFQYVTECPPQVQRRSGKLPR